MSVPYGENQCYFFKKPVPTSGTFSEKKNRMCRYTTVVATVVTAIVTTVVTISSYTMAGSYCRYYYRDDCSNDILYVYGIIYRVCL